jgi:putative heme-binding domain-containing protein
MPPRPRSLITSMLSRVRYLLAPLRSSQRLLVLLVLIAFPVTVRGQRDAKVPDPDPEIERKSFQLADGFEVNLFAADPLLAKPIQMNFDAAGRLWVATSEVYPQIKPGQKANDKIVVVEDTKGVGRADKVTVFADGLLIPTGVEPGDGGAYVADSTDLLFLKDTDGDGKADQRRVILSGFGTEDTHHIVHTFRWGPDGMLYFNQSTYIHSHIETPYGVRRLGGGGIWQFRPETMRLEIFARGLINPWGNAFDRWGQTFATDGAGGEGINYMIPGGSYAWTPGATRIVAGLNPGSPKYCGLEILSGRHLPADWQGNLLTNDFRGHRVCRFVVTEDGAGFASREQPELIKTNHPAFRPVDIKMGPDGAIYIADWYNPIIQHGEVDFRDPRRDVTHGRIWRVTAKGRPLVPRPQLVKASTEQLLDALKSPEDWTRHHAKRVLKERGSSMIPALASWVARLNDSDPQYEHDLLEALWTYQSLDKPDPTLLGKLLQARDYHARATAVRVLGHWRDRLPNALELLTPRVTDDHPRVRLEAVRVLGQIPGARSAELAMAALDLPVDKDLDYALWLTAREREADWLPLVHQGNFDFGGKMTHLIFALQAVGNRAAVKPLVDLVRAGKVPPIQQQGVLTTIASLGGPTELGLVLDGIFAGEATESPQRAALLASLVQAARQRKVRPAGDLNRLDKLVAADETSLRAAAARAAGLWKVEAVRPRLVTLARAADTPDPVRQAAIDGLGELGGPVSRDTLNDLAGSATPAARSMAIVALTTLDLHAGAAHAAELFASAQGGFDPTSVVSAFLERKGGPAALTKALANRSLPQDVAKIALRVVRTAPRPEPTLADALTKAGNLTVVKHTLSPEEFRQMVSDVQQHGDPARGEVVFRRADQACFKCHAIAGAGGQVGPDLVSIGASAQVDYLVESILLPNKIVKEGFHSLVVATKDGKLYTGIKVRDANGELVLRNAEDREIAIAKNTIDEQTNGGSLMPEGLADPLTRTELVDLVRFLSELGKVGPYSVSKARVVRRWQVLEPTPEAYTLLSRSSFAEAAGNDASLHWLPAYSKVAGMLPVDGLPRFHIRRPKSNTESDLVFARCQLDASTSGPVRLLLGSSTGLMAWLDGSPLEVRDKVELKLTTGGHTLTFAVDPSRRKELRCELDDVLGSAAQVRVIQGK